MASDPGISSNAIEVPSQMSSLPQADQQSSPSEITNSNTIQHPSRFLSLPQETLDKIYGYVFEDLMLAPVWKTQRQDLARSKRALSLVSKSQYDKVEEVMWKQVVLQLDNAEAVAAFNMVCVNGSRVSKASLCWGTDDFIGFLLMKNFLKSAPNLGTLYLNIRTCHLPIDRTFCCPSGDIDSVLEDCLPFICGWKRRDSSSKGWFRSFAFIRWALREAACSKRRQKLTVIIDGKFQLVNFAQEMLRTKGIPRGRTFSALGFRFDSSTWSVRVALNWASCLFKQKTMEDINGMPGIHDRDLRRDFDAEEAEMMQCFKDLHPFRPMDPKAVVGLEAGWSPETLEGRDMKMWRVGQQTVLRRIPTADDPEINHYIWSRILKIEDDALLARPYKDEFRALASTEAIFGLWPFEKQREFFARIFNLSPAHEHS